MTTPMTAPVALNYKFTLITPELTCEQDRAHGSFAEFIADRAEAFPTIDWSKATITRVQRGEGVNVSFTLDYSRLKRHIAEAKHILEDREELAKAARELLENY